MSKKEKKAFDFYVLHFNEQERSHGQTFYNGRIVTATDNWRTMTLQEREPFEKMAKNAKQKPVVQSQGNHLSQFQKKKQEHEAMDMIKATIKAIVENSSINNTMAKQEYYFIDGNYFIVSLDNCYYPAELALIKFTFEDGVVDEFHTFVNPGKIPIGYAWDAKEHSLKTHQLPVPPNAIGEKNFNSILQGINEFLGNPSKFPPLFTLQENIPKIESFMKTFYKGSIVDPNSFRIYPIHQLMFELKEQVIKQSNDEKPGFESIRIAKAHLDYDKYLYKGKTACKFHDENDCSAFCPLSSVKRWSYTLMDSLCVDLNISLTVGKHFPAEVDISHLNNIDVRDSRENNTTAPIETQISSLTMNSDFSTPEWQMHSSSHTISHQSSSSDDSFLLSSNQKDSSTCYIMYSPNISLENTPNTSLDHIPNTTLNHTPNTPLKNSYQEEDLNSTISTDFSLLDAIRSNGYSVRSTFRARVRGRGQGHVRRIDFDRDEYGHAHGTLNRSTLSGAGRGSTFNDKSFDLSQDTDIDQSSISVRGRVRGKRMYANRVDVNDDACCGPINPSSSSRRGKGPVRGKIVSHSEYID